MAFYDDRRFLLSHLHHSFITCDDTGMCEMAMLNEPITLPPDDPQLRVFDCPESLESELLEGGQSYDIVSGMGFIGGHRHRSNTAQRLEKLKKDKQVMARLTRIQWKDNSVKLTEKELKELFPKKDMSEIQGQKKVVKSALSEALEMFPAVPNNPFSEYARFDGRVNRSAPSKTMLIYLTMLPTSERNYGMEVICLSNARVHELVGLICWMYTNQGKEPKLNSPVSNYCLKIAEETGEVDEDFPSLDANEFVGKFGFPFLALIEKKKKNASLVVTMYIDNEMLKFDIPSPDITLRELAEWTCHRIAAKKSTAYHIETLDDPGTSLSLETMLSTFKEFAFRLIFEDDVRERLQKSEEYNIHMKAVEAPLYRTFNVTFHQKMGMNYDVQLGISGEKVEINPLPQKGAAKLLSRQQKPATLYIDHIATCEIVSKKYSPGRCIFKLVHQADLEFKKFVFETDPSTAQDIVKKVQLILEMHTTSACKEYQLYRERKLLKKMQKSQSSFTSKS